MRRFLLARGFLVPFAFFLTGFSPEEQDRPCLECHPEVLEGRHRHLPVEEGACEVCHEPGPKAGGVDRGTCLDCHDSIANPEARSRHPFVRSGECHVCHFPHASDFPRLLIAAPVKVCAACHPDQIGGRSHPVGQGIEDPRTGGALSCTSTCHEPHTSPERFLVRETEFREVCEACHDDKF